MFFFFWIKKNKILLIESFFNYTMLERKSTYIDAAQVRHFRLLGFSFSYIADHLNISARTLSRWRHKYQFDEPKMNLCNEILDEIIGEHIEGQPRRGEKMVSAFLSNNGYRVPRSQLRGSIHRVDPEGSNYLLILCFLFFVYFNLFLQELLKGELIKYNDVFIT